MNDSAEPTHQTLADAASVAPALPAELSAAVASLADLDALPLAEHLERYQLIHTGLQDALRGIEGV